MTSDDEEILRALESIVNPDAPVPDPSPYTSAEGGTADWRTTIQGYLDYDAYLARLIARMPPRVAAKRYEMRCHPGVLPLVNADPAFGNGQIHVVADPSMQSGDWAVSESGEMVRSGTLRPVS